MRRDNPHPGQMADGGLAEYVLAPQYMCIPYDPALSPTQAVIGVTDEEVPLPMLDLMLAEKTVATSRSPVWTADFAEAVRMLAAGTIDTDRLVTDVIPLSATVDRGFRSLTESPGDHLKIAVVPDTLLPAGA